MNSTPSDMPTPARTVNSAGRTTYLLRTAMGPIEVSDDGHGIPVVALHGGLGGVDQSRLLTDAAITDAGYRVIAVSRPGYLGSPLGDHRTSAQQADVIAALLDALGLAQAVIIAVSAGGPCALQFALRHAGRCRALVLVSCCTGRLTLPPEYARRLPMMRMAARLPFLLTVLRWIAARDPDAGASRSIADTAVRERTMTDPLAGPLLRTLLESRFDRLGQRLSGTLNDMAHFESITELPLAQLTVPTLVVHGSGDRVVPFAHAERVARGAPGAQLLTIEGGEHVALFTHMQMVRERVGAFLSVHA